MIKTFRTIGVAAIALLATVGAQAQTNAPATIVSNSIPSILTQAIGALSLLPIGSAININGQSFTYATNAAGQITGIVSTGASGTVAITAITTPTQAAQTAYAYVQQNNPADAYYYGTNDLVAQVSVDYVQNEGTTLAEVGVAKYGWISSYPQVGFGASVLQGNQNGSQSTAGATGGLDYRKVIGSVAAHVGADIVYDAWTSQVGGLVKAGVELRQGQHLGEFAGAKYEFEAHSNEKNSLSGLWLTAAITYSF